MNETEETLIQFAHTLGIQLTQPIHESWQINLPEGMTLETFVRLMAEKLPKVGPTE